jgi:hypothetical protein
MSNDKFLLLRGWNVGVITSFGIPSGLQGLTAKHGIISLTENSQPPLPHQTQISISLSEILFFCNNRGQTSHIQSRYDTSRGPYSLSSYIIRGFISLLLSIFAWMLDEWRNPQ